MRFTLAFFIAISAFLVVFITLAPVGSLLVFLSDDAYYYLNVAYNNARGDGLTFDGLNPSNGWHPLWMLIVQPVYLLFANFSSADASLLDSSIVDKELALRAILIIQTIVASAAIYHCWRFAISRGWGTTTFGITTVAAVTLMAPVPVLLLNGLETPLVLLVQVVLIRLLADDGENLRRVLIGAFIGLLFLSRLDTAFIILALAIWLALVEIKQFSILEIFKRWWAAALVAGLMAVAYFSWNTIEFGQPMPISGALKTTFPEPHLRIGFLERVPHFAAGIVAATAWLGYRYLKSATRWYGALMAIAVGCLVHLAWSVFFMAWGTFQWHFITYVPVIVFAAIDFLAYLNRWPRVFATLAVSAAITANLGLAAIKSGNHSDRLEAAIWASANLPEGPRIGLRDAGVFGYFTKQQVVNLDGLINGYAFQDSIHNNQIETYLKASGVEYIADAYVPCNYTEHAVQITSLSKDAPKRLVGEIRRFSIAQELHRSESTKLFEQLRLGNICFVIWEGRGHARRIQ